MGADEARAYWDRRHQESGALASGGHIGYAESVNAMLYAVRTARLVEVLGGASNVAAPLKVLDAGCGKGYFSRALASFGHLVDGIDTSPAAVESCRQQAGPNESYAVSSLTDWAPTHLYDAVLSIDVLYHILDDEEWQASVRSLASLVRLGGLIGLVDHEADEDRSWRPHQKTRAVWRYRELLEHAGFVIDRFVRNDFRKDPSGMHVAVRVG